MIVSNGRRHQEVFNGSVLSEFAPRDSVPARWPFQKNPVPRGRHHSDRPPNEVVGANLNRASSARATPPSDGVVFHNADDKFLIAARFGRSWISGSAANWATSWKWTQRTKSSRWLVGCLPLARCTFGGGDEYSGQRHKGGAMAKATTVVNGLSASGPSAHGRHPYLYGTLVALVGFLLVALPAAVSALDAALSFTGCPDSGRVPVPSEQGIFGCHEPERLKGTLAALVALVLLALPVIAGVLTARAVSRRPGSARTLKILALVVLLGTAVPCAISVIMIHGAF